MGGGPKYIHRDISNPAVLDALVALTGRNFRLRQGGVESLVRLAEEKSPDKIDAATRREVIELTGNRSQAATVAFRSAKAALLSRSERRQSTYIL